MVLRAGRCDAEPGDVGLVERRERVHVGEEAQRLGDIGQRRAHRRQLLRQVLDGLRGLRRDAAAHERTVLQAELAADDDPVAGADDGCVRAERFAHRAHRRLQLVADLNLPMSSRRSLLPCRPPALALVGGVVLADDAAASRSTSSSSSPSASPTSRRSCRAAAPADLARRQGRPRSLSGPDALTGRVLDEARRSRSPRSSADAAAPASSIPYWAIAVHAHRAGHCTTSRSTVTTATRHTVLGATTRRRSRCRTPVRRCRAFDTPTVDNHRGVDRSAPRPRAVPVPRGDAHRGARDGQAGRLHGRHAGALPDSARAPRASSSWSSPQRAPTATESSSCTPRSTPTTLRTTVAPP